MAYFEWVEDLAIDHGAIDEDHRLLVDLVNRLHDAADTGLTPTVVAERMAELVFYTQDHLLREEVVMAAVGFVGLDEHRESHRAFMLQMGDLQRQYLAGKFTTASQLAALLSAWLEDHIRESDSELREHLKNKHAADPDAHDTVIDISGMLRDLPG
ncbi:MAG: bacteriohemerythrin [Rhodoferax sp.]